MEAQLVLGFPDSAAQAEALAEAAGVAWTEIAVHRFPDGESKLTLPGELPEHVVIVRSLDRPNDKLVELLLASEGARALGAKTLTLVCPYLGYMRQDAAFHPGEVVSQRVVGRFLAGLFDGVITVDPHLHRVASLAEAIPARRAVALSAARAMGAFLKTRPGKPLLIGPDRESQQWVSVVAEVAGLSYAVADKVRSGDQQVDVRLPEGDYAGRDIVLVDDVASTGRTLIAAARALCAARAAAIDVLVTHALFVDDAVKQLKDAGVRAILSSDSVPHPTNAFALAPLLADALEE